MLTTTQRITMALIILALAANLVAIRMGVWG